MLNSFKESGQEPPPLALQEAKFEEEAKQYSFLKTYFDQRAIVIDREHEIHSHEWLWNACTAYISNQRKDKMRKDAFKGKFGGGDGLTDALGLFAGHNPKGPKGPKPDKNKNKGKGKGKDGRATKPTKDQKRGKGHGGGTGNGPPAGGGGSQWKKEYKPDQIKDCPKGHCHNWWVTGKCAGKDQGCKYQHELRRPRATGAPAAKPKPQPKPKV